MPIAKKQFKWKLSLAAIAGMHLCSPAYAEPESALRPYLDYIFLYDDNVLRLSSSAAAQAAIGTTKRSDTANRIEGGFIFEKEFSRQLVTAKLNLNHTKFNQFGELDHSGGGAVVNWNWHYGNHLQGNVGADFERALTPFTNFHLLQRNMRDVQHQFIDAAWELHPRWRIHGGFTHYGLRYDLTSQRPANRDEDTAEVGVDYLAPSSSAVGLVLRRTHGTFPDPQQIAGVVINNDYDQNDVLGKVDWRYSEKTRLQFLGGWSERKHDFLPERDYQGSSARLIASWLPTYKIGATFAAWREVGATDNLTTSYTLNKGVSLVPTWTLSAKTKLEAMLKYEKQDYSAGSTSFAPATLNRKDTVRYASVKVTYAVLRKLMLAATLYHDKLDSNIPQTDYSANGIWLNARYTF